MTSEKNGLAGLLRKEVSHLNFHCVCHKLALAQNDCIGELKYIDDCLNILRQTWQLFEYSPKKSALFIKVQENIMKANLSSSDSKMLAKKLQKACKTRWLSFDASVKSVKATFYPLLVTLTELENDSATAAGLLGKMRNLLSESCSNVAMWPTAGLLPI